MREKFKCKKGVKIVNLKKKKKKFTETIIVGVGGNYGFLFIFIIRQLGKRDSILHIKKTNQ